jgi:ketosteroid isomerase-like protein
MSENLELVRSIYAAWERGDFFSSPEWAHPEIEYVIPDGPDPGSWKGVAALVEGAREWLGAWEDFRIEVDEYRELDDERILVLIHSSGRGKTSGVDLGQVGTLAAELFTIRDRTVTSIVPYWDRDRALADLGLKE